MERNRSPLATAGLFVAWLTHDLEELATMTDTSHTLVQQLPDWVAAPASIREHGLTTRHVATGIATSGSSSPRRWSAAIAPKVARPSTRTHCLPLACMGLAISP